LAVYPLNIFAAGLLGFEVSFQSSWDFDIGFSELKPCYRTPDYFCSQNHFTIESYFAIDLDGV